MVTIFQLQNYEKNQLFSIGLTDKMADVANMNQNVINIYTLWSGYYLDDS